MPPRRFAGWRSMRAPAAQAASTASGSQVEVSDGDVDVQSQRLRVLEALVRGDDRAAEAAARLARPEAATAADDDHGLGSRLVSSAGITQIRFWVGGASPPSQPGCPSSPFRHPNRTRWQTRRGRIRRGAGVHADRPHLNQYALAASAGSACGPCTSRRSASVLLVGEAVGYRGARVSVSPSSERQLTGTGRGGDRDDCPPRARGARPRGRPALERRADASRHLDEQPRADARGGRGETGVPGAARPRADRDRRRPRRGGRDGRTYVRHPSRGGARAFRTNCLNCSIAASSYPIRRNTVSLRSACSCSRACCSSVAVATMRSSWSPDRVDRRAGAGVAASGRRARGPAGGPPDGPRPDACR